jgi:hypothetical protein
VATADGGEFERVTFRISLGARVLLHGDVCVVNEP